MGLNLLLVGDHAESSRPGKEAGSSPRMRSVSQGSDGLTMLPRVNPRSSKGALVLVPSNALLP